MDGLVTAKGASGVCWAFRQISGELIRSSHGECGSISEQRHAGRRVAEKRDPAPCPIGYVHAGDLVKIHVVRRAHGIEKLRYSPADTGIRPLENAFVLVEIGVVEPGNLLVPENKYARGIFWEGWSAANLPGVLSMNISRPATALPGKGSVAT